MSSTFDHLLIIGRPAAGKSEFIDMLKKTPEDERKRTLSIGHFDELDDFLWIWQMFMEDDLWESVGHSRQFSVRYGTDYGIDPRKKDVFDFMMAKFNAEAHQLIQTKENYYETNTLFIEFARGNDVTYEHNLQLLSDKILARAAILYIQVSADESWRRNLARYEEKKKHSILAHMLPREAMDDFYLTDDWASLTNDRESGFLTLKGRQVPFVTVPNEPEIKDGSLLAKRYEPHLQQLMKLYQQSRS